MHSHDIHAFEKGQKLIKQKSHAYIRAPSLRLCISF